MEIILQSKKHGTHEVLVDDEDYEKLINYNWCVNKAGYAVRHKLKSDFNHNSSIIYMHRCILNIENTIEYVDHINGNKLDNRKENLRVCTDHKNKMNRAVNARVRANDVGYKGVYLDERNGRFVAKITYNSKAHHIGVFDCEKIAAKAYDQKAREFFGEFACLNFPSEENDVLYEKFNGKNEKTGLYGIYIKNSGKYEAYVGSKYICKSRIKNEAIIKRNKYIIDNNLDTEKFKLNEVECEI